MNSDFDRQNITHLYPNDFAYKRIQNSIGGSEGNPVIFSF